MSSISSIGSTFIPLTSGTSTTPVSNTGTQNSTPLTFDVRQDVLGVPLAGGSLGLPTGGAPGDTEALLALVALKLRQTMGTMNNNAVETRMNQYAQMLQQAQSLIAAYVNASNILTTSQMTYQTTQTALSKVQGKLQTLYAPLTGDGNQQNLQAVTADASGGQGTYGQYLAALQDYQGKNQAYSDISTQVTQDQAAYNTALAKASTTDPSAYYQSVYMARQTQQQQLTTKQKQLAGMNPPQQLSASEQATLQTLNGAATTTGSVAEAAAAYQTLTNTVANANSTLQTDLGKQSTALQNLVATEKTLIPYLDSTGGTSFTDKYPQNGIAQSYNFDQQALQGVTVSQTGIISTTMNVITELQNNKKALQQTLKDTQTAIDGATATLNQFGANDGSADPTQNQMLVLLNLTQSLTTALAQHTSDQSSSGNSNESNDDMLSNRFERNDNNIDALNESQDIVSKIADLRRRIAAMFDNPAGQTAVQLASGLTSTLLALVGLLDQPAVVPSSSDLFQTPSSSPSQSSSSRMRIPV